jgi:hypothetical protein
MRVCFFGGWAGGPGRCLRAGESRNRHAALHQQRPGVPRKRRLSLLSSFYFLLESIATKYERRKNAPAF